MIVDLNEVTVGMEGGDVRREECGEENGGRYEKRTGWGRERLNLGGSVGN